MNKAMAKTKSELRKQLRMLRNTISLYARDRASHKLCANLNDCGFFAKNLKLAFYLASDGEINTLPSINLARKTGCKIYIPSVKKDKRLRFHRYGLFSVLKNNKYNIAEVNSAEISPIQLDVIFLPVVGFDRKGQRLGMGGGYYDRTLDKLQITRHRPLLVGLAYQLQEIKHLQTDAWDISLDCIVTEKEVIDC